MSRCDCILSRTVKIRERGEKSAIRSWWSLYSGKRVKSPMQERINIFRSSKFSVKDRRGEKYSRTQSVCIGWCIGYSSRFSLLSVSQGWKNAVVCILNKSSPLFPLFLIVINSHFEILPILLQNQSILFRECSNSA